MVVRNSPSQAARIFSRRAPLISSRSSKRAEGVLPKTHGEISASAFAPGHVTGIFRPQLDARDPRARGSVGAGVVLELGVRADARFRPGRARRLQVSSDLGRPLPISAEVARRLAPRRPGLLRVRLAHALPVGQGFGMSAAGASATALAVARLSGRSPSRAFEVAHLADLFGGGGLGGVAALVGGGGLEFRERAGLPPWGRVLHRPLRESLFIGTVGGPLPSPRILKSAAALRRLERAGEELPGLLRHPETDRFFDASERFTDRAGLAPRRLRDLLRALRGRGAWAAQAMFGRSFFARPRNARNRADVVDLLSRAGASAIELRPARTGARRVPVA
jgi:pantoate kinase